MKDYQIITATNGKSALEIANSPQPPDLVLLDVMMPNMDGYTVLQKLKENPKTENLAVLFITAKCSEEEENYGLSLGALDYVTKPFNTTAIKIKVNNHMQAIRQRKFIESLAQTQYQHLTDKVNEQHLEQEQRIANYLENLKTERERLQLALWASGNQLWDWDLLTGDVERSGESFILPNEYPPIHKPNSFQTTLADYIHPSDTHAYQSALNQVLNTSTDTFFTEYRVRSTKGNWVWVQDKGRVVTRNDLNQVTRMAGTLQDIQARKQTEKDQRIAANAFQNISDGIWVADQDLCIQTVNQAFCAITGIKAEEAIGQTIHYPDIDTADISQQGVDVIARIKQELHLSEKWVGEIWSIRKNELYLQNLRIVRINNKEDDSIQHVGILTDITYRRRTEEELIKLANYDTLTTLPNRTLLYERLRKSLVSQRGKPVQLAVVFIDLDNFKRINDTLGHSIGDQLLIEVGGRLKTISRDQDTVARLGGDEFIMIYEPIINNHIIAKIAQRVIDVLSKPFLLDGYEINLSSSLGIAVYPEDGTTCEELIKHADIAMYEAKAAGKSTFRFYTEAMNQDALKRLELEAALRKAITNNEIFLHYQPKIDVTSGKICGLEVLARWQLDDKMIPPDIFIAIAEETGLILPLGKNILTNACQQYQQWVSEGLASGRVAVNVSTQQFISDDLIDTVKEALKMSGLSPDYLELEITETTVVNDTEKAIIHMHKLRELGISLAIDDFGTGYSSLNYLKRFPINTLKIDQCFISEMLNDLRSRSIVELIINMAHTLGLNVVAEGVEYQEQADIIQSLGCGQIQGYLFSPPIKADCYEALLREQKSVTS